MWLLIIALTIIIILTSCHWIPIFIEKVMGAQNKLLPGATRKTNSCIVSFDDEKITHLRKINGKANSIRWDALDEIYLRLTDTGPHENEAYFMFVAKDKTGCSISTSTEGMEELLQKIRFLYWFSDAELFAGLEAIKTHQLEVRKFLLWSSQRNGVNIPVGFSKTSSTDSIQFDDENIFYKNYCSQKNITITWAEMLKLNVVFEPTGHYFKLIYMNNEFHISTLADGLQEFMRVIRAFPGYNESESILFSQAARACNLQRTEFMLFQSA